METYILKDASMSADQLYRYSLTRIWHQDRKKVLFIMFNPSTADHKKDDHTIKRVVRFAKDWGYGGIYVANLYAFRSKKPANLKGVQDPQGPNNRDCIINLLAEVSKVIYAWGNHKREPKWLKGIIDEPYCIATSKKGIPKHPLYLRKNLALKIYERK